MAMPAETQGSRNVVDLVVVGSGAAGLAAAATAAVHGARVCVLEKTEALGGTSALSGGEIWIPCSRQAREAGIDDSASQAETYLRGLLGESLDTSRTRAFLQAAPEALAWLERHTHLRYALMPQSTDYHSEQPGACHGGRSLAVLPFDGRALAQDFSRLRWPLRNALVFGGTSVCTRLDLPHLLAAGRRLGSAWHAARLIARGWAHRAAGHPRGLRLTNGNALVARLLATLREQGVETHTRAEVRSLIVEDGRVCGVEVAEGGTSLCLLARRGVVLATGGFSASARERSRHYRHSQRGADHHPLPPAGNDGDAFALVQPLGVGLPAPPRQPAAWAPVSLVPRAHEAPAPFPHFSDRGRPGIVAVGPDGERFVNESASYHDFVTRMLDRGLDHAWLLADHRALRRYGLGAVRPFPSPLAGHLASGYLRRGRDWAELARSLGLPAERLQHTLAAFNAHAARGSDPAFHRGESLFDQRCGDADHRPNPTLAPLQTTPFYAVKVLVGDIGTFIGLPTDGAARVLNTAGTPVPGLYAAGNAAQSLFGGHYPSAGITLGPALTFGWLAARNALGTDELLTPSAKVQDPHHHADTAHPLA
jgi:succinate dehydrogenase/fumarate reductase flavoprotein subunit